MHEFSELACRCANFGLSTLSDFQDKVHEALQTSGATTLVKALQMISLQKAVLAVGMFSMFEAELQGQLKAENGFAAANKLLEGHADLRRKFMDFQLAINVLKHGRGRSYDMLVEKAPHLPFQVVLPNTEYEEGIVSEVDTLIFVDDQFVQACATVIEDVSEIVRQSKWRD